MRTYNHSDAFYCGVDLHARNQEEALGRQPRDGSFAASEGRRFVGTRPGPIPHSCLAPPRLTCRCQSSDETPSLNHPDAVPSRRVQVTAVRVCRLIRS